MMQSKSAFQTAAHSLLTRAFPDMLAGGGSGKRLLYYDDDYGRGIKISGITGRAT